MADDRKNGVRWLQALFMDNFGLSRGMALGASLTVVFVVVAAVVWFFHSAPPHSITISAGPAGSSFEGFAQSNRVILARSGVT